MKQFLFGVIINLVLSFCLSFTVGIATCIYNEMPIMPDTICLPLLYGTVIGTITTTVIPVNKLGIKFATWCNAPMGTAMCTWYKNFVIVAIMVPIMNLFVTGLMIGFTNPELINAWLYPIPTFYPVAYVTSMLMEPIGMAIASAITRFKPGVPEPEQA